MKFISFGFCLATSFFLSVSSVNANDITQDINNYCNQKWSSDYEMQNYCREQMNDGLRKVSSTINKYGKESEEYRIVGSCYEKWYPQFDMIEYCSSNQISAYNNVREESNSTANAGGSSLTSDINNHCNQKWSSDYEMQNYCREQMNDGASKISKLIDLYGKNSEQYNIISKCWGKWYPQLDMVEYCSNNQISAYSSLK